MSLAVRLKLLAEDVVDFVIAVFVPVLLVVAALAAFVFGIGYGAWYLSAVECDHLEHALDRPTRLDTWGDGCMVDLGDGTEIPVGQYHVIQQGPERS